MRLLIVNRCPVYRIPEPVMHSEVAGAGFHQAQVTELARRERQIAVSVP
jgi:hypothetical protein